MSKFQSYFDTHNTLDSSMIRSLSLVNLIKQHGIPSKIRGKLWLICSGSLYNTFEKGYYYKLLKKSEGNSSLKGVLDEIEKDVRRYQLDLF